MPHPLEEKYGLSAVELLEAIERRFRLKVALEGAVAETHFERKLKVAAKEGWLESYTAHDQDNVHDYTVRTLASSSIRIEVKSVKAAKVPQVELRKTRAAKFDPSNRLYDCSHFDVVAVCMGRSNGDWSDFVYCKVSELPLHSEFPGKLKILHDITRDHAGTPRWFSRFQDVIDAFGA